MPEICRFDGIVVKMFYSDHNPPHFHAEYAEFIVEIDIRTLRVRHGLMPNRQQRRILRWARNHQSDLMDAWDLVRAGQTPQKINNSRDE